jgi:uncharacterized integral membrane protein
MWLKIKVWTKVILFGLVLLYALIFVFNNSSTQARLWYWFGHDEERSVLFLVLGSFLAGVVITILVRTTFKTLGQIRDLQSRGRADKLAREVAEMKSKAAALRTRDIAGAVESADDRSSATSADSSS